LYFTPPTALEKMKSFLLVLFLAFLISSAICQDDNSENDDNSDNDDNYNNRPAPFTVNTQFGPVTGRSDGFARVFLGVRYAAPPVGQLRWAPARNPDPWTTPVLTQQEPSVCVQTTAYPVEGQSEDCLFLNVHTPLQRASNLPVLVFIHGGRYWTGAANDNNGSVLASSRNAIVVAIQYRLNIFGFLTTQQLIDQGNLNLGLKDQNFALNWVQENIERFGGDPSRVTIFGESAGAGSVMMHLFWRDSWSLYQNAIFQSVWEWIYPTPDYAKGRALSYAARFNCTDPNTLTQCLRAIPATQLLPQINPDSYGFAPVIDGNILRDTPFNLISSGRFNTRANLIWGNNLWEGSYSAWSTSGFRLPSQFNCTKQDFINGVTFRLSLAYLNPTQINQVLANYEPYRVQDGNYFGMADVFEDHFIICGQTLSAPYLAKYSQAKVYTYIFNQTSTGLLFDYGELRATHSNELDFIWNGAPFEPPVVFNANDYVVVNQMQSYWSNLAKRNAPTEARHQFAIDSWPAYSANQPNAFRIINDGSGVYSINYALTQHPERCAWWKPLFQDTTFPPTVPFPAA